MPQKTKTDTPAMRQYKRFKQQHPGCVLFFRMGDFYEMFYEDAELAHRTLGVTLTQRTQGVPMAGVPYHAVEGYLRRMIQAGHRVAVCEQVEDARQAKGVVKRDVTRVVTPGTLTDEAMLEAGKDNPLAGVVFHDDANASAAWCELSTGRFELATMPVDRLADWLNRVAPCELLYCETATGETPRRVQDLADQVRVPLTPRPAYTFGLEEAVAVLHQQYEVTTLRGFGLDANDPALQPAGAVLAYLHDTQRTGQAGRLAHLQAPVRHDPAQHLVIDPSTLASLEVVQTLRGQDTKGSLLGVLQRCRTAMGKRQLRQWLCFPLRDLDAITARQDAVQTLLHDDRLAEALGSLLDRLHDMPRISARLALGRAAPRDLVALARSASQAKPVAELLDHTPSLRPYAELAQGVAEPLSELAESLSTACVDDPPAHLREGGFIRDGHDAALDRLRTLQTQSHRWLSEYQQQLAAENDLPNLKVGYNKVFGYYIELTAAQKHKAPEDWSRKQTLKNAERYITPRLKEFEGEVLTAESKAQSRELELFEKLCTLSRDRIGELNAFAQLAADLDVLACFAEHARRRRYVRPTLTADTTLHINAGRHPVLDDLLEDRFVPNDVELGGGAHVRMEVSDSPRTPADHDAVETGTHAGSAMDASPPSSTARSTPGPSLALITGPNMAGKSTYIRQTALITLLAHTGSFVPADEAIIGLCDRIFTRVGSADELHAGQSTFMVEMVETANLCHHATAQSLVVLDEVGRGTSTLDGLALAWAIAEHLARCGCRTLFATHYHELTQLADTHDHITNLHVTVREWNDDIVFLHRIARGATDKSYGLHVAKIAGLPSSVVQRARQVLDQLAVSHAARPPADPASPAPPPSPQLSLFREYLDHPALAQLRGLELDTLSPMQAFDQLRKLQEASHSASAPEDL